MGQDSWTRRSSQEPRRSNSGGAFAWAARKETVPEIATKGEWQKEKPKDRRDSVVRSQKYPYPELLDISQITPYIPGVDDMTYISHANKYLGWNIDPSHPYKLNKKRLTKEEVEKYKEMGEPDSSQNYLELFTPDVVSDMLTIMNLPDSNATKARFMIDELSHFGFKAAGGEGTNIVVILHDRYPGVVFKIALDSNGIADNFNDGVMQYVIPRYTRVFARDMTGIVSVQERSVTLNSARMEDFKEDIMSLLEQLSEKYLVADLSPVRFLNFGVARDGEFVIQDGSDLYPIADMDHKFRCQNSVGWDEKKHKVLRCGGKLRYTTDFLAMVCEKCGHEINPLELRPRKEGEGIVSMYYRDSTDSDDRLRMEQEEIEMIRRRISSTTPDGVRVEKIEVPDEDAEELVAEPEDFDQRDDAAEKSDEPDTKSPATYQGTFEEPDEEDEEDDGEEDAIVQSVVRNTDTAVDVKAFRESLNDKFKTFASGSGPEEDDEDEEETAAEPAENIKNTGEGQTTFVDYKIVKDSHDNSRDGDVPGIYITIHGNFDDAWELDGLPIYVSIDGEVFTVAVRSGLLKTIIGRVIDEDD